jgi:hypothetical protein
MSRNTVDGVKRALGGGRTRQAWWRGGMCVMCAWMLIGIPAALAQQTVVGVPYGQRQCQAGSIGKEGLSPTRTYSWHQATVAAPWTPRYGHAALVQSHRIWVLVVRFQNNIAITLLVVVSLFKATTGGNRRCHFKGNARTWF